MTSKTQAGGNAIKRPGVTASRYRPCFRSSSYSGTGPYRASPFRVLGEGCGVGADGWGQFGVFVSHDVTREEYMNLSLQPASHEDGDYNARQTPRIFKDAARLPLQVL